MACAVARRRPPCGRGRDLNIAHTEDDIWNPKGNAKTSGFLPRAGLVHELLADGWVDSFRHVKARARRSTPGGPTVATLVLTTRDGASITFCNPAAAKRIVAVDIVRQAGLEVSDHAPCILDLAD